MHKKLLIAIVAIILVNIILFLIFYWALERYLNDPNLPDQWFPRIDVFIGLARVVFAVLIGLFLRKEKRLASLEMNAKKYACVLAALLFFWGVYYFHSFESGILNFIVGTLARVPSGDYYDTSPVWMFVCETFVAPNSLFSFIVCWGCLMFPKHKKVPALLG